MGASYLAVLAMFKVIKKFRSFVRRDDGSATIEAVIWFPVYIGIFCLMADVALIFNGQTMALRTLQDANRRISVGRMETTGEVETYIKTQLAGLSPNAVAASEINAGAITSTLTIPASDLAATAWFASLVDIDLVVSSEHIIEY